jgi:hypothetical protein
MPKSAFFYRVGFRYVVNNQKIKGYRDLQAIREGWRQGAAKSCGKYILSAPLRSTVRFVYPGRQGESAMDSRSGAKAETTARPDNGLQAVIGRVVTWNEVLAGHVSRLAVCTDRVLGAVAEKDADGKPRVVPNGLLGMVNEKLDDLAGLSDALGAIVDRIEAVL